VLTAQTTVVSAADYQPTVAPGSIAAVFGSGFSSSTESASLDSNGQLPTQLGRVSVALGSQKCPLFYVSPTQINLLIPASASTGQTAMVITTASGSTVTTLANVTQHAPGIFQIFGNRGAVINAVNGQLEPFVISGANTFLSIFATGLNTAANDSTQVAAYAQLFDGSIRPLDVQYAGPQGQYFGLDQVNINVPQDFDGIGEIDLFLICDTFESNHVPVVIRQSAISTSISVSPTAAQPNTLISIWGQGIGTADGGRTTGKPRFVVTFENAGRILITAPPASVSPDEITVSVPYDPLPDGSNLSGDFSVCVTADDTKVCSPTSFSLLPLSTGSTPLGGPTQQYLNALAQATPAPVGSSAAGQQAFSSPGTTGWRAVRAGGRDWHGRRCAGGPSAEGCACLLLKLAPAGDIFFRPRRGNLWVSDTFESRPESQPAQQADDGPKGQINATNVSHR
jgi:uncharacterized protein (TIGR03437 family)